jgi:hypothetical protein
MSVKNTDSLTARARLVQDEVNKRQGEKIEAVVRDLANSLFLSERTIWRDLAKRNE